MAEPHEMTMKGLSVTGFELWECGQCTRSFLLSWPPHYEKRILDHGDESVQHVGAKGGVRMGRAEVTRANEPPRPGMER